MSPYSAVNLLKTPGNPDYDSDGRETPRRSKLMRTPQYFSPGKRLFTDDSSPNKKELVEISSQLKSRLSSAFGTLQQKEKAGSAISPVKLDFSSGSYIASKNSPTRMTSGSPPPPDRTSSAALNSTNLNLQTLQASPRIETGPKSRKASFDHSSLLFADSKQHQTQPPHSIHHSMAMPSPDEESSAHNALMVALSRVKERRRSHNNEHRRPSFSSGFADSFHVSPHKQQPLGSLPLKLPPINARLSIKPEESSEQEAIYSLMSLSSPQSNKHDFSSLQTAASMQATSHVDGSKESSRSSSVVMPVLPPVSGLIRKYDDDETDVEENSASDDDETS
ncbi:hypothetical protein JCM33374_g4793 [Metschnikowia sp. JCM 33374]|nr:hypothetical protein JCM33374_g4793 [Metschnikowia sp. JCM 33374]